MSFLPRLSSLALRQLLLVHTAAQKQSDLRQTVIWLRRFGFSADDVSNQLGFTLNEMRDHVQFVDIGIEHHQIDTTLYLGVGRFGKLFCSWAELQLSGAIKGEQIDTPVRDVLAHVLGFELDVAGLQGFMSGWHAGHSPHHGSYEVAFDLFTPYLQILLEQKCYPGSVPTTRQEFLRQWCNYRNGQVKFPLPARVVGVDNDDLVIQLARNSVSNGPPLV